MLGADLLKRTFVRSFEHRPEALYPVRVCLLAHVLSDAVLHAFVRKRVVDVLEVVVRL